MRKDHRCPKCNHEEILYIPEPRDGATDKMAVGGMIGVWTGGAHGQLEAFVCVGCGYTELYVKDVASLDVERLRGVRLLTPTDPRPAGPYR